MKLAVISDLHGNYYALAKVLAFLRSQEIDGIIGLGDRYLEITWFIMLSPEHVSA